VLRQLQQIRRSVPTDTFQTLVASLMLTHLDNGNSVLPGLPVYLARRLQSVLNTADVSPASIGTHHALVCLHWLRVLVYKVLHGLARAYLGALNYVAYLTGRRPLRSATTNRLTVPPVKLTIVANRAFLVVGLQTWNDLPDDATFAELFRVAAAGSATGLMFGRI